MIILERKENEVIAHTLDIIFMPAKWAEKKKQNKWCANRIRNRLHLRSLLQATHLILVLNKFGGHARGTVLRIAVRRISRYDRAHEMVLDVTAYDTRDAQADDDLKQEQDTR